MILIQITLDFIFIAWENGTQRGLFEFISRFGKIYDDDHRQFWEKISWEKHLDALEPSGKVSGKLFVNIGGLMLYATANFDKTTIENIRKWKKIHFLNFHAFF